MASRRALACLLLLAVVLAPVLGAACEDLSASSHGPHRGTGLRHQPLRAWRTLPATLESPAVAEPRVLPLGTLEATAPPQALPLVVRTPFVPPRR